MREELVELLRAEPFAPFQITLASGQVYTVRHPGLAILGKDIMYLMAPKSDLHSVLRLVQIAAIDIIE